MKMFLLLIAIFVVLLVFNVWIETQYEPFENPDGFGVKYEKRYVKHTKAGYRISSGGRKKHK
jgi:hypothetical protein